MKLYSNIIFITIISFSSINSNLIAQDSTQMIWPFPPNEPKISYVSSFSSSKDLGIKKSFFHKLWDRVSGFDHLKEMLVQPIGITGDDNGNIYITDPGADCVHIFNFTEKVYRKILGKNGNLFKSPIGVAVSESGLVFVSDSELGEIQIFQNNGDYEFTLKDHLKRPTGICISQNILYVTDTELHKIFVFSLDGKYLFDFGVPGIKSGEFNRPIFITKKSLLYVIDALNFRVQVLDEGFNNLFSIGHQGDVQGTFSRPKGVAVDSDENIYVVDGLFDAIQIFNFNGELLLVFGKSGIGAGEFDMPAGIFIDNDDQIYVADTLNRRIQIFKHLK